MSRDDLRTTISEFVSDYVRKQLISLNQSELNEFIDEIIDEILLNKLWPGTLKMAQAHISMGQEVWLVTASPNELADKLAKRVGLTGGIGTRAEVVDGIYTGRLDGSPLHEPFAV